MKGGAPGKIRDLGPICIALRFASNYSLRASSSSSVSIHLKSDRIFLVRLPFFLERRAIAAECWFIEGTVYPSRLP